MRRNRAVRHAIAAALAAAGTIGVAAAQDRIPGPVPADLVRVVDGDTLRVRAWIWIDQSIEVLVRIRGVDAPELRAGCPEERAQADAATAFLALAVGIGPLSLTAVEGDKYFGRVVADVDSAGTDLAAALFASGLARPYDGGTRATWCPDLVASGAG
ncbi:MAG: thermonuclease family protein [Bauldia sp.]|nr:thermonuclease family protein [Bauldia sp.]